MKLLLTYLGWVPKEQLFDPSKRNPSIIFGLADLNQYMPPFCCQSNKSSNSLYSTGINGGKFLATWFISASYMAGWSSIILWYVIESINKLPFFKEQTKTWFKEMFIRKRIRNIRRYYIKLDVLDIKSA